MYAPFDRHGALGGTAALVVYGVAQGGHVGRLAWRQVLGIECNPGQGVRVAQRLARPQAGAVHFGLPPDRQLVDNDDQIITVRIGWLRQFQGHRPHADKGDDLQIGGDLGRPVRFDIGADRPGLLLLQPLQPVSRQIGECAAGKPFQIRPIVGRIFTAVDAGPERQVECRPVYRRYIWWRSEVEIAGQRRLLPGYLLAFGEIGGIVHDPGAHALEHLLHRQPRLVDGIQQSGGIDAVLRPFAGGFVGVRTGRRGIGDHHARGRIDARQSAPDIDRPVAYGG